LELLSICPVCHYNAYSPYLTVKDHTVSREEFKIVTCDKCGFRFTNPRPDSNEIGKYYASENYISHSGTSKGLIYKLYHLVRKYAFFTKYRYINRLAKEKSLLDIGCGTGDFLGYCKNKNWQTVGIEPFESARQKGKEKYGIEVFDPSEISRIPDGSISIITMWHVLEHIHVLDDLITEIKRVLKPNGYLIVAVPNINSHDAKHYQSYWDALDIPLHLYHFTPADIKTLFGLHNMHISSVRPMIFDAFYVSMLSEKHLSKDKGTSPKTIRGFIRGLISNVVANKETYSSQMYTIRFSDLG
jgi:SAM-dependent methyltransferase